MQKRVVFFFYASSKTTNKKSFLMHNFAATGTKLQFVFRTQSSSARSLTTTSGCYMFVSAGYAFAALCNRNTSSSGLMNHMVFMKHLVFLTDSIPGTQLPGIHRGGERYLVLNGQYQSLKRKTYKSA